MKPLHQLIQLFLKVNPQPTDKQFHAFAEAVNVDKEELEAASYAMLGDMLDDPNVGGALSEDEVGALRACLTTAKARLTAAPELSQDQKVLINDYVEESTPPDLLLLNDGELAVNNDDPGYQQETEDDGVSIHDSGVGLDGDQLSLDDDGVVDPQLRIHAGARLRTLAKLR